MSLMINYKQRCTFIFDLLTSIFKT